MVSFESMFWSPATESHALEASGYKQADDQLPIDIHRDVVEEDEVEHAWGSGTGSTVDADVVSASNDFEEAQKREVARLLECVSACTLASLHLRYPGSRAISQAGTVQQGALLCPLCAQHYLDATSGHWRRRLEKHLRGKHSGEVGGVARIAGGRRLGGCNYTATGFKQFRVARTLFDADRLRRVEREDYLARSAVLLRRGCVPSVGFKDRHAQLLFDYGEARYGNRRELQAAPGLYLRVGYACVTRQFCELFFAEFVMGNFAFKEVRGRLVLHYLRQRCEIAELLPGAEQMWWRTLAEKMLSSSGLLLRRERALQECVDHGELEHIALDGLFRPCRSIVGQADYQETAKARQKAPVGDEAAVRRIVSVRGRTGAVVCCMGTRSEAADEIALQLREHLPAACLRQVRTVATDNPGPELLSQLRVVMPSLEFLVMDLVHICFLFESAQGRHKTRAGQVLRTIQCKWNKVGDSPVPSVVGDRCELTQAGVLYRQNLADRSMPPAAAKRRLARIDGDVPYTSASEYVGDLAALCAAFPDEVSRTRSEDSKLLRASPSYPFPPPPFKHIVDLASFESSL